MRVSKKTINTTQKKKLALDYLRILKENGSSYYDLEAIEKDLINYVPNKKKMVTIPLDLLKTKEENLSIFQLIKKRVLIKLQSKIS